jgi:purine-cytosine permease-like protein
MVGRGPGWLCDAPPAEGGPVTNRDATAVPFDAHGIGPIPVGSRDSTPWEQFWIWAGANIAPINWVLGALGIILGLSLVETLVVVSLGNVVGCAVFGLSARWGCTAAPGSSTSWLP